MFYALFESPNVVEKFLRCRKIYTIYEKIKLLMDEGFRRKYSKQTIHSGVGKFQTFECFMGAQ